MYCKFPKTNKSTCTIITFHSNIPPLLSCRFFISSFYLPTMMLLQGGVLAELPAGAGASSTPTSPRVSPDPPECDAHRRERGASLHRASIPPPPPGSLQAQRSCRGPTRAAPRTRALPHGALCTAPPPQHTCTRALPATGLPALRPRPALALSASTAALDPREGR